MSPRYVEPRDLAGQHPVDGTRIVLERISDGPYAGRRMAAHLYQDDRRIVGTRRRPYYGHIWRLGARWIASCPGGTPTASFATRWEAKSWIARQGRAS